MLPAPPTAALSRRSAALVVLLLLVLVAVASVAPTSAAAASRTIDSAEAQQVRKINRFRAARGLPTLRIDGTLSRTAAWMARDMGVNRRFSHTDSRGRDPFQRMRAFGYPSVNTWRGENLAAGNAAVGPTYQQWLNSPPHKRTWLNPNYRAIGIARVRVAGSPYGWYWATEFGSRRVSAPA